MVEKGSGESAACCNTVHIHCRIVRNMRIVPIVPSHSLAIDEHEYAWNIVTDFLQNVPHSEVLMPRY